MSDHDTAIAIMGNAGMPESDARTSLEALLSRLQPTTEEQVELMKSIGMMTASGRNRFYDSRGRKPLAGIAQVLQDSLIHMSLEHQAFTLGTLFGSDAARGAAILARAGNRAFAAERTVQDLPFAPGSEGYLAAVWYAMKDAEAHYKEDQQRLAQGSLNRWGYLRKIQRLFGAEPVRLPYSRMREDIAEFARVFGVPNAVRQADLNAAAEFAEEDE